jgi:hypothetical protein
VTDVDAAPPQAPRRLRWWVEVLYGVGVYLVYSVVRNRFGSASGDPGPAFGHALDVIRIERDLHLFFEANVQRWYLDLPGHGLIRAWNVYYGIAHFLVTLGALVWLFRGDQERYPLWRNTLAITTCLAVVGFAAYSLMPPRLLDDAGEYGGCQVYAHTEHPTPEQCDRFGFVDTVDRYGGWISFGNDGYKDVSNQYAAMPSMHIGWSTWCALVLVPLLRRRWAKVLAALYPVLTLTCIVLTANHYWIDGVGGLVCLSAGFGIARLIAQRRARSREISPAPAT